MKWFIKWGLAAVIAAGAWLPSAASAAQEYSDVTEKDAHYETIMAAQELGLLTGYADGTFKSSKPLQRGNVIKALGKLQLRMLGDTLETYPYQGTRPFRDIPRSHADQELFKYSIIVKDAGIFEGDPNGNVSPGKLMTRQQMAKVLVNAFGLWDFDSLDQVKVTDIDKAFWEYQDYILLLSYHGVTNVSEFRPLASTTRGQFASFLVRSYEKMMNSPIESIDEHFEFLLKGETPELPEAVYVYLENGMSFLTPVEWNLDGFDPHTPGEYILTGTMKDFPDETTIATIWVCEDDECLDVLPE